MIPWKKLIEFHKEIVTLSDESFFKLDVVQNGSYRWSAVKNLDENPFVENFLIQTNDFINKDFITDINDESTQFLGYHYYFEFENLNNQWIPKLVPLFYKEVKIVRNETEILIFPVSDEWSLSSLFINKVVMNYEIKPDDIERIFVEGTQNFHDLVDENFHEFIITRFESIIPNVRNDILRTINNPNDFQQEVLNTKYILFKNLGHGVMNRQLINDYISLQQLLAENEIKLGGLNLLQRKEQPIENELSFGEYVQLDETQVSSVKYVMKNKLTVISGPPGTGKSQTVLSILLNAWKNNKSALFVSNNRQAVDVVHERISKIERDYNIKITIKANRNQNNQFGSSIVDVIDDVIFQTALNNNLIANIPIIEADLNQLYEQRGSILFRLNLDTMILSENYLASRRCYADVIQKRTERQEIITDHNNAIGRYFTDTTIFDFEEIHQRYIEWMSRIPLLRNRKGQMINSISVLQHNLNHRKVLITNSLHNLDIHETPIIQNIQVDLFIYNYENWLTRLNSILNDINTVAALSFNENEELNQRWENLQELRSELELHTSLINIAQSFKRQFEQTISHHKSLKEELEESKFVLNDYRIDENIYLSESLINSWILLYQKHNSSTEPKFNFLNLSNYHRNKHSLRKIENEIKRDLPHELVDRIWKNDEENIRILLHSILLKLKNFYDAKSRFNENKPNIRALENEYSRIKSKIENGTYANLNVKFVFDFLKIEELEQWIEVRVNERRAINNHIPYFENIENKRQFKKQIHDIYTSFQILIEMYPFLQTTLGNDIIGLCDTLENEVSIEIYQRFKNFIDLQRLAYVLNEFQVIHQNQEGIIQNKLDIESNHLAYESEVLEWWNDRPQNLIYNVDITDIPDDDHPLFSTKEELLLLSTQINDSIEQINLLSAEVKHNLNESKNNLRVAINIFPESEFRNQIINEIENENYEPDFGQLNKYFDEYDYKHLQGQIYEINNRICHKNIELTKIKFYQSIANNVNLQNQLNELRLYYNNLALGQNINIDNHEIFQNCLSKIPIWVTNAHQTNKIPMIPELFDYVIIDEASQCHLTNFIPIIFRAKNLVVIGDEKQLPPIYEIKENTQNRLRLKHDLNSFEHFLNYDHLSSSLFDKCTYLLPNITNLNMLANHYRSNPLIIGFSNKHIYRNFLKIKKQIQQNNNLRLAWGLYPSSVDGQCERGPGNKSWFNIAEVGEVNRIIRHLQNDPNTNQYSIGIITPFAAQEKKIKESIQNLDAELLSRIKVGSVHKFQGDERDVIIFSIVASDNMPPLSLGFIEEPENLLNVAVTRAREALFVVGNFEVLRHRETILGHLIRYAEKIKELRNPIQGYNPSHEELILFSLMIIQGWDIEVHKRILDMEVDFLITNGGIRTVIEVDGLQHYTDLVQNKEDQKRDQLLTAHGYQIYRTSTRRVRESPTTVINDISQLIGLPANVPLLI